jgi:hypothetical protein
MLFKPSGLRKRHIAFDFLFGIEYRLDAYQPLGFAGSGAEQLAYLVQLPILRERGHQLRLNPENGFAMARQGRNLGGTGDAWLVAEPLAWGEKNEESDYRANYVILPDAALIIP